jgi:Tfp pilus assembly protein PilF
MAIPEKLDQEIKAFQGRSQSEGSNRSQVSKEDLCKIIDDLRNKLKSNPYDSDLHHALAVACFSRGLFLSSEENFLAAIRGNPQDATLPYNLGILYYSAQPKMNAEKPWQEALRLDPAMGNAHHNLSYLYYESGQYQSAWKHCQKAIQLGIAVPPGLIHEIQVHIPK